MCANFPNIRPNYLGAWFERLSTLAEIIHDIGMKKQSDIVATASHREIVSQKIGKSIRFV
jgi:hypothetical protein